MAKYLVQLLVERKGALADVEVVIRADSVADAKARAEARHGGHAYYAEVAA